MLFSRTLVLPCLLTLLFHTVVQGQATRAQATEDQVLTTTSSSFSGRIVGSTPTGVTVEVDGNTRQVPLNEIKRVMFAEEPSALTVGRVRALSGNYESAQRELKKINPQTIGREMVRRDLQFFLAYCQGKLALTVDGDRAAASESLLAFVRAAPNSFHFFDAARLLGDLAVSRNDFTAASRYYGTLASKMPFPSYRIEATIAQARALLAAERFDEARETFDAARSISADSPEARRQKRFAQIGLARCLAATGSAGKGIESLQQLIAEQDESDAELFAHLYNALGSCQLEAGNTKAALMAYLHVDILFYSDPDAHAESLYQLSELWKQVGKPDRSAAAGNLLQDRYPATRWTQK